MIAGNRIYYCEYFKILIEIRILDFVLILFQFKLQWENIRFKKRVLYQYRLIESFNCSKGELKSEVEVFFNSFRISVDN